VRLSLRWARERLFRVWNLEAFNFGCSVKIYLPRINGGVLWPGIANPEVPQLDTVGETRDGSDWDLTRRSPNVGSGGGASSPPL
jgi:hypothetical protein